MTRDDLQVALACAALLDEKYHKGGGVTFELQAANSLRILCDEVGALHDEITVAVAMEREACARFVEKEYERQFENPWREDLAEAIRARGETK